MARDDEEGASYFNPDTGRMVILPPGSAVVLGRPWIRVPDLPAQTYLRAPATETWANPRSLERHFDDHADDFNARDQEEYAGLANKFYTESASQGYRLKVESDGTEYIYDPKTNTFRIYNKDGKTITFFKPFPKDYWSQQPGHVVRGRFVAELVKSEGKSMSTTKFMCPVCGYPSLDRPARFESGSPFGEYCPCCGFQFGCHDSSKGITYDEWRRRWVAKGMPWSTSIEYPPPSWDPRRQLIELARRHHVVRSQEEFRQRYE